MIKDGVEMILMLEYNKVTGVIRLTDLFKEISGALLL
jgi:hypothetical protein